MKKKETNIKRPKRFELRFSENEWNELQNKSTAFGVTMAEYVRWSLFDKISVTRTLVDDKSPAIRRIIYLLDRTSNNINQITRLLNTGYVNPEQFRTELRDMHQDINHEVNVLHRILSVNDAAFAKELSKYSMYNVINKTEEAKAYGNS